MKEIKELQELIIDWAKEKNLNDPDKQYLKILEEVGETSKAILHNDIDEIKDGIGDIAVTVIIYYWINENELSVDQNEIIGVYNSSNILNYFLDDLREDDSYLLDWLYDLATNHNTTLKECLNLAWNEIKDRKGKTINGTFIKNG